MCSFLTLHNELPETFFSPSYLNMLKSLRSSARLVSRLQEASLGQPCAENYVKQHGLNKPSREGESCKVPHKVMAIFSVFQHMLTIQNRQIYSHLVRILLIMNYSSCFQQYFSLETPLYYICSVSHTANYTTNCLLRPPSASKLAIAGCRKFVGKYFAVVHSCKKKNKKKLYIYMNG